MSFGKELNEYRVNINQVEETCNENETQGKHRLHEN